MKHFDDVSHAVPQKVIEDFAWHGRIKDISAVAPGLSGAAVFRVSLQSGVSMALKRFPASVKPSRIENIHSVMNFAGSRGCVLVPELARSRTQQTQVFAENSLWEAAQWKPGAPLTGVPSIPSIALGAQAIAQFHHSVRPLHQSPMVSPGIQQRLQILSQYHRSFPAASDASHLASDYIETYRNDATIRMKTKLSQGDIATQPPLASTLKRALELLHQNWRHQSERLTRKLNRSGSEPIRAQYVLRDVHREHILFQPAPQQPTESNAAEEDRIPSGLIDFDAVRVDTPILDLARWTGSFLDGQLDPQSVWQAVLAGYQHQSSFSQQDELGPREVEIAQTIHETSQWIGLANWVDWIVEGRHFAGGYEAVSSRIGRLCQLASATSQCRGSLTDP